jgi:hypothetical protein
MQLKRLWAHTLVGYLGWIPWLDTLVGYLGWIPWLDTLVGYLGWIPWLDTLVGVAASYNLNIIGHVALETAGEDQVQSTGGMSETHALRAANIR